MTSTWSVPEEVETYRDATWRRESDVRVEDARSAESFVEGVGFCSALTDCRRPGPSLYIAVCGRRDAFMPRNVQKDAESSLTWMIKDEVMRRGRVYYGKLLRNRSTFIARKLVPHFHALCGVPKEMEEETLSRDARIVLKVLRVEWELASRDLREASQIRERGRFNKAIDELQKRFKVIPTDVIYKPIFTYVWSLVETRFQDEVRTKTTREESLKQIAGAYLKSAGMTRRGELASVTGMSRPDAGSANWALVDAGEAVRLAPGVYRWRNLSEQLSDA